MMIRRLALAAATTALATAFAASPVQAQEAQASDRYNTVIIYGDDACPASEGDTITVCARMDESERYRIPPNLRESDSPTNESWSQKVRSYETVGEFGPMSCTPVGAGGELGCTAKFIEAAYEEKANSSEVRFSQLIAEARGERLSTIDAETAETQARVEALERAYFEKLQREQEADIDDPAPTVPPAEVVDPSQVTPPDLPPPSPADGE